MSYGLQASFQGYRQLLAAMLSISGRASAASSVDSKIRFAMAPECVAALSLNGGHFAKAPLSTPELAVAMHLVRHGDFGSSRHYWLGPTCLDLARCCRRAQRGTVDAGSA